MPKAEMAYANQAEMFNTALGWRMVNPKMEALYGTEGLGITAENVAERYEVSREAQDEWALQSHQRAANAQDEGWFDDEIVSISVPQGRKKDPISVTQDESVRRDTSLEKLAKLKPVFKPDGTVTAGNASPLNDGACAVLLMSLARAKSLNLEPMARSVCRRRRPVRHVRLRRRLRPRRPVRPTLMTFTLCQTQRERTHPFDPTTRLFTLCLTQREREAMP